MDRAVWPSTDSLSVRFVSVRHCVRFDWRGRSDTLAITPSFVDAVSIVPSYVSRVTRLLLWQKLALADLHTKRHRDDVGRVPKLRLLGSESRYDTNPTFRRRRAKRESRIARLADGYGLVLAFAVVLTGL
jgi:hypothetical protein